MFNVIRHYRTVSVELYHMVPHSYCEEQIKFGRIREVIFATEDTEFTEV